MVGGGVAGEQAGRVADQIGGRREGRGSPEGFSVAEGISSGKRTATSRSRGRRWGLSGWGGSTRQCGARSGVESVGGGLEQAVCGGSAKVNTVVFRAAQERWRRKKGGAVRWGAPFIAARGGGTKVARRWNHGWQTVVVATVGTSSAQSRRRRPDSEADERAPRDI
jgi:hypothetical protein